MNTSLKVTAVIGVVFAIGTGYGLMEMAHARGYSAGHSQGYKNGQESMVQTEQQVFMQCTQWWFGEGNPRARQAMDQYCERR